MRMILTLAVVGGCVMSSSSNGMRDALRDAQSEEQVHADASRSAADLPSLIFEIDRHSLHMTVILDDMSGHMSSMPHCAGMGTMMNMRDGMQVEIDDHQITMHAMRDVATARGEDEHHLTVMSGMLDDMNMQLDGMHCGGMW
jgi:hypothetical protein